MTCCPAKRPRIHQEFDAAGVVAWIGFLATPILRKDDGDDLKAVFVVSQSVE